MSTYHTTSLFWGFLPPNLVSADQNPGDSDSAKYNDTSLSSKKNTTHTECGKEGGRGEGGGGEAKLRYAMLTHNTRLVKPSRGLETFRRGGASQNW